MDNIPHFVPSIAREIAGDDALGLAPVNESLYGSVFPGINNVVQYIRVYSVLCWKIGLVEKYLSANENLSVGESKQLFNSAMEKIQLLLTWTNIRQKVPVPSLPGATRPFPLGDAPIKLVFESFGTNRAAYLEAAQYRPSITNGLEFVDSSRAHGILGNFKAGVTLGDAFDQHARGHDDYAWLSDITALETTPERIANFKSVFDLRTPSSREQEAFLAQYFPESKPSSNHTPQSHRWASLLLTLRAIEVLDSESYYGTEENIRITMARGLCFDGTKIEHQGIEVEQQWWAALQLRQLQRLALDTLELILERHLDFCIQNEKRRDFISICDDFRNQLTQHLEAEAINPICHFINTVKSEQGDLASIYHIPKASLKADIFDLTNNLKLKIEPHLDGTFPILVDVFNALVVCVVEAENMRKNKYSREAVDAGFGGGSLGELADSAQEFSDKTPGEWIGHLLQHWVINRHFYVATYRSERANDGKNRFRFVLGDTGLQRFDMKMAPSKLGFAQDRLRHALLDRKSVV